jgi:DNA repair protein RadC
VRSTRQASADEVSVVFTRVCPRFCVLRATSRRQARRGGEFAPAVTQLLMLRGRGADARGRVSFGAGLLSRGRGEESSSAPSERNAKNEHDRRPHHHRVPRSRSASDQQSHQADQIPASTAGMENRFIEGMSHTRKHSTVRTPDQAAAYWKSHIPSHPYFNPECECLVVFILNTRRRIKGHYLVSIGTMDTILCHPREIFRLAVMASAAAIIIAHNHPSGDPTPSEADIKITRDLIRAGQLLKIEVLDHIVMGHPNHTSIRSLGYFL